MAVVASGRGPAATAVCGRFRGNRPGVSVEAHAAASPLISGLAGRRSFRRWQSETCADTADDPLAISNAMTISCTFLSGTWMPPCPRCPQPAYGPCGQNSTSARRFIVVSSGPDAVGRRPYVSDGLASSPWSDSAPPTSLATSHSSRPACCSSCPVPLKWPDHQPLTWLDQIEWHAGAPGIGAPSGWKGSLTSRPTWMAHDQPRMAKDTNHGSVVVSQRGDAPIR